MQFKKWTEQMKNNKHHKPVLLQEAIEYLNIKPSGTYIDCTLGEGGHSIEILKRLDKNGKLISIDRDEEAISFVREYYKKLGYKLDKEKIYMEKSI